MNRPEPLDVRATLSGQPKVAIVHYWLTGMRGGEFVLEQLVELFPDADIFTHVLDPGRISDTLRSKTIRTTFIDRLPLARTQYPKYLALMPRALELLDLSGYDLVISSESGPAKGVLTAPGVPHFCYCHTPMRYIWDMHHEYRATLGWLGRLVFDATAHRMRLWDLASASRVDHFIANSTFVSERIQKVYRRDAAVINPPADLQRFEVSDAPGDYYLFVSELVPYKRADIAVRAFASLDRPLKVVGQGPEATRLSALASSNVEFLGRVSDEALANLYAGARALVFPGIEDFGIVPIEAMACGRPVIAFRRGGVCDSVVPGVTGLFFEEQTSDALVAAVHRFEEEFEPTLDCSVIAAHARRFSPQDFRERILAHIAQNAPALATQLRSMEPRWPDGATSPVHATTATKTDRNGRDHSHGSDRHDT